MTGRQEILTGLRKKIAAGRPVVGGGAGTGLSAKCAEAAGLDFVVIYNSGRYRMAGVSSMAGLMPYGDANLTMTQMAAEVLPIVKAMPVIAGVCGTDPFRLMPQFLRSVRDMGCSGVQNYPTVCLFDGTIRANLEETGLGFYKEVEMIAEAHRLDLLTVTYVESEDEARAMAAAGADILVPHMGLTTAGMIGARTAMTVDEAIAKIDRLGKAARETAPDIIIVAHGGPIAGPAEVERVLAESELAQGFLGASSMERLPTEVAMVDHMSSFTKLPLRGARGSMSLHVAVVGLVFGADFVPIYQRHPGVREVSIVDTDPARLAAVGDQFGVSRRHADLESVLADPDVDAVHLLTPVAFHARQSVAVLEAGKHCACAVPMATALHDLHAIIGAAEAADRHYMMMETTVFSREYFYVEDLLRTGKLGEPTFYRGFHLQDLDGFAEYWRGYPPMHYLTHALSPLLALTGTAVKTVQCLGSGRLTPERVGSFDNPFPLEVGLFTLRGSDVVADITMSFFQTARDYTEGFALYGEQVGVEWPVAEGGPLRVHEFGDVRPGGRGREVSVTEVDAPDRADLLPAEIAGFTRPTRVGGGHGGSHPHLVHEFVTSILDGRPPRVDARTAAAWTAPGICAHDSALAGGSLVEVPLFAESAAPAGGVLE